MATAPGLTTMRSKRMGTGGYLFDDGTFETSRTTALQLYSADGSYVADVRLNEYGDLAFTPVIPGYK